MNKHSLITALLISFFMIQVHSQNTQKEYTSYEDILIPNEVIVQLKPGVSGDRILSQMPQNLNFQIDKLLSPPTNIWLYTFDHQIADVETVLDQLFALDDVHIAQVNTFVTFRDTVPNDPLYSNQWHHPKIQSPAAWDITTGGTTASGERIVVCVIESANVMGHPDLQANHWKNLAEIPNNGIDDDGNGYIDDYNGWNVPQQNDNIGSGSHGSSVAGMIGAVGDNNLGVVGANWDVDIMVVAMHNSLTQANVIAAYTYPLIQRQIWNDTNGQEGAFVVAANSSWGIDYGNPNNYPLWCQFYDTMGEAGILSCGATSNSNLNIDVTGDMPTACPSEYMIAVTASNASDIINFAGYGVNTIDVAAPGSSVYTTSSSGYTSTSGTSFATPLTAGVIGLMYSIPCESFMDLVKADPATAAEIVRDALFDGVDQTAHLLTRVKTGGRINSKNAIDLLMNEVCSTLDKDVGVKSFITPADGELTAEEEITIVVRNYGSEAQSGFPVYYNIDGGADITETFTNTLDAATEVEFTFATTADLGTAGAEYTITAGTALVGDENEDNDELTIQVTNTTTVGIDELPLDGATFYVLTLENNQFEAVLKLKEPVNEDVFVKVINIAGQTLSEEQIYPEKESYTHRLDMTHQAAGVYFVRVGTSSKGNTQRILVK